MSRSWTPEEIQMVSEVMKAAGHMGYEEFCADFDEQMAKAALERFARVQRDHRFACPRCGQWAMKERTGNTSNVALPHLVDGDGTLVGLRFDPRSKEGSCGAGIRSCFYLLLWRRSWGRTTF